MCGLAGVFSEHGTPADLMQQFGKLMTLNTSRGCHSFGVLQVDAVESFPDGTKRGRTAVTRRFGSYNEHVEAALSQDLRKLRGVFGHTRAPTGKARDDPRCIHPLSTTRFLLAHNGILLNSQYLLDKFSPRGEQLPVDSWALLAGIHNLVYHAGKTPVEAIQLVCEEAEGQHSCWLFDSSDGALYLFRQMSPLFLALPFAGDLSLTFRFRCPGFAFSSTDFKGSTHSLEEGKVVLYANGKLGAVGGFSVKRHY